MEAKESRSAAVPFAKLLVKVKHERYDAIAAIEKDALAQLTTPYRQERVEQPKAVNDLETAIAGGGGGDMGRHTSLTRSPTHGSTASSR